MTVRVHIERLLLDGFAITPAERMQLQIAVQQELGRLLSNPGLNRKDAPPAGTLNGSDGGPKAHPLFVESGAVPSVAAGSFNPPHGATPMQLGQRIASAVYGGLGNRR